MRREREKEQEQSTPPSQILVKMITLPSNLVVLFSLTAVASCESSCPLWLAPSYITELSTESPKYGLYAGVEYPQDATLPLSELAIPLIDFFGDFNRAKKFGSDTLSFLESFLWTQEKIGSMWVRFSFLIALYSLTYYLNCE